MTASKQGAPMLMLVDGEGEAEVESVETAPLPTAPRVGSVDVDYARRRVIVHLPGGEWEMTAAQAKDLGLTLRAKAMYIEETVLRETTRKGLKETRA